MSGKKAISRNIENVACIIILLFKIMTVTEYDINVNAHLAIKCNANKYFIDFRKYIINVNIHSKTNVAHINTSLIY